MKKNVQIYALEIFYHCSSFFFSKPNFNQILQFIFHQLLHKSVLLCHLQANSFLYLYLKEWKVLCVKQAQS